VEILIKIEGWRKFRLATKSSKYSGTFLKTEGVQNFLQKLREHFHLASHSVQTSYDLKTSKFYLLKFQTENYSYGWLLGRLDGGWTY